MEEKRKPGLYVEHNRIIYSDYPKSELGIAYCKPFSIDINHIQCIAIRAILLLDEECLFILIIDKDRQIYPMPYYYIFNSEGYKNFEILFELVKLPDKWSSFSYENHSIVTDKILFPPELYGRPLFKSKVRRYLRRWYGFIYPHSYSGKMNID